MANSSLVCPGFGADCFHPSEGVRVDGLLYKGDVQKISSVVNTTEFQTPKHFEKHQKCAKGIFFGDSRSDSNMPYNNDLDTSAFPLIEFKSYASSGLFAGLFRRWRDTGVIPLRSRIFTYEGVNSVTEYNKIPHRPDGAGHLIFFADLPLLTEFYRQLYVLLTTSANIQQVTWSQEGSYFVMHCTGSLLLVHDPRELLIYTSGGSSASFQGLPSDYACARFRATKISGTVKISGVANYRIVKYGLCFTGRASYPNILHVFRSRGSDERLNKSAVYPAWTCTVPERIWKPGMNSTNSVSTYILDRSDNADVAARAQLVACSNLDTCEFIQTPSVGGIYPPGQNDALHNGAGMRQFFNDSLPTCACTVGRGFRHVLNVSLPTATLASSIPRHCAHTFSRTFLNSSVHFPPFSVRHPSCTSNSRSKRSFSFLHQACFIVCFGDQSNVKTLNTRLTKDILNINAAMQVQNKAIQATQKRVNTLDSELSAFSKTVHDEFLDVGEQITILQTDLVGISTNLHNVQQAEAINQINLAHIHDAIDEHHKIRSDLLAQHNLDQNGCVVIDDFKLSTVATLRPVPIFSTFKPLNFTGVSVSPDESGTIFDDELSTGAIVGIIVGVVVVLVVIAVAYYCYVNRAPVSATPVRQASTIPTKNVRY